VYSAIKTKIRNRSA